MTAKKQVPAMLKIKVIIKFGGALLKYTKFSVQDVPHNWRVNLYI